MIVFVAFLVELAVNVYGFRGENWFYTALDGVATFSLILDFWFVQDAMAGTAIDPLVNQFQNATGPEESAVVDSLVLTRASRAARAGTKIGRLVKLTRLLRVGKMVSLASKARAKKDDGGGRARNMAGLLGRQGWGSGRPGLVPSRETTRARWATRP